ncbi:hypothetical protein Pmar_PMAR018913, partial [Perkinsus marinus ATCC 50983]
SHAQKYFQSLNQQMAAIVEPISEAETPSGEAEANSVEKGAAVAEKEEVDTTRMST